MILITRPKDQSINLKSKLEKKGHNVFQESFYKLQYQKKYITYNSNHNYIFSSIHSVKSLKRNRQIHKLKNANILVVGKEVKKILKEYGCKNPIIVAPDSHSILKTICSSKHKKKKYIYFCSNIINEDFFNEAINYKINIKKIVVYKTIGIKSFTKNLIDSLQNNKIGGVILYSQLAAKIFFRLSLKNKILSNCDQIQFYCLSERIAKPLKFKNVDNIHVAKKPNERSLISIIKKSHYYKK